MGDIHEACRTNGDMICAGPTRCVWVALNARKPVPFGSSHYVLYLESTIVVLNIDCSSQDTIHLHGYVNPHAVNWEVTDFVRVGVESLQVTYDSWCYVTFG